MTATVELGTSGWSYKDWEGIFYPRGEKNKLSFYSKYYNTVEIDSSFYAYPKGGMVQGLARYTPDDFAFCAKLPKLLTHEKRLDLDKGVKADLLRFLSVMRPLLEKGKLAAVLVQLPPSFSYKRDGDNLKRFLAELPGDIRFAVEFRNLSWLREETWELLRQNNVANTIVDEPLLPPDTVVTSDFAFVRWHGRAERPWYDYRYSDEELEPWKDRLTEVASKTKKVYGYFNNHFRGFAIENSLKMIGMLGKATPEQSSLLGRVTEKIERTKHSSVSGRTLLDFG